MKLSLDLFLDQLSGMDQWDTVTAAQLTKIYRQINKILTSVPCEIPERKKKNWSFIMYDDAKFTLIPGICTRDSQTGVITAGTAVTVPHHPGAKISTTYADGIRHQETLELWHNYESACEFATKALDHALGSTLLDKQDENGALTDEAKALYQGLWTDKMTGMMKDR